MNNMILIGCARGTRHSTYCRLGVRRHLTSTKSTPTSPNDLQKAFAVGGLAGILGSLAGMGGGFVMIPLMTSRLLGFTQHQAHGTSLFAVASTGFAGAISYYDHVQWENAIAIALCGMVTARFGAKATIGMDERTLKRALGMLMICMAPVVPAKAYLLNSSIQPTRLDAEGSGGLASRLVPSSFIGLGSGFLAGFFGVGGGTVVVPALTIATDCNHYQALATSLAAMTLPAASGTLTHYRAGNVVIRVAPALALGSFVGAFIGGKLGQKSNETALRFGFSSLLAILGARTLLKT